MAEIRGLASEQCGGRICERLATSEDYKLLENMNKLTCLKYMEMKDIAGNISRNLKDLNKKYSSLQPYLEQINQIEEQVASLENAAYKLDAYSKRLVRGQITISAYGEWREEKLEGEKGRNTKRQQHMGANVSMGHLMGP
ncbi:unnamed protein product [Ranitomeya imitator]|uniref:Biogenesis of lysosome-related organelles complex 1 subunit 2 n=1 Tax=Ranitomeya imitator TaxID=111125 RepID=A0ABN9MB04_9NEOB|nr:unnamed protein product [Ranitomeya imitator]